MGRASSLTSSNPSTCMHGQRSPAMLARQTTRIHQILTAILLITIQTPTNMPVCETCRRMFTAQRKAHCVDLRKFINCSKKCDLCALFLRAFEDAGHKEMILKHISEGKASPTRINFSKVPPGYPEAYTYIEAECDLSSSKKAQRLKQAAKIVLCSNESM